VTTSATGSVRVDLLGGTLDFQPIHLILPNVVTLNLATTLQAKVSVEAIDRPGIEIHSLDYKTTTFHQEADLTDEALRSGVAGPLSFVLWICKEVGFTSGIRLTLQSGSPPGSGLGGSSSMGVTLYKALCEYKGKPLQGERDKADAIACVRNIESLILDAGPAGYQDYYPAVYGGILALRPTFQGVAVEQLYDQGFATELESLVTLVHSNESRNSGINNWEVYKGFFDRDKKVRKGLGRIAELSFEAYQATQRKDVNKLVELIAKEGEERKELFPGIVSSAMKSLYSSLKQELPHLGMKACGAGGGGAYLLVHRPGEHDFIREKVVKLGMQILEFSIAKPLD
jgi:D-glycero-alpha-D-manno-heptose-7-phosphate kinase